MFDQDDDALRHSLCLCMVPGIGPRTYQQLLDHFGSAEKVLCSDVSKIQQVPGVGPKTAAAIVDARKSTDWETELNRCRENQIDILLRESQRYPKPLELIADPPNILFARGEIQPQDSMAVAIVGTRHATSYGRRVAERLSRGLAMAGFTIVSGLARGIDAVAHRAALKAGGRTIAVLGSGLLNVYPSDHQSLADEIVHTGAVLSEFSSLQPPKSTAFPQRNRIVTGLSLGVVVIEAAARSGALISARLAMEQDREVFAVPGSIDSRVSRGCHGLLRDGATLVENIDDIIDALGPLAAPVSKTEGLQSRHPAEAQLNEQETQVLQAISTESTDIDSLVGATGLPISRILSTISVLEIKRLVDREPGNRIRRR